jgi:hypothetical protein
MNNNITKQELISRIKNARNIIIQYGGIDGDHHKAWVLDQTFRYLCGCPTVMKKAKDYKGQEYEYETLGTNDEYNKLVLNAISSEYPQDQSEWDIGIAP